MLTGRFIVLVALASWLNVCPVAAAAPDPVAARRVVLLYDERIDLPGLGALDSSLVQGLRSDPAAPLEVYREAMDLSRFGSDGYIPLLRDHLRAKYAAKKVDVVVAVMGPALDFLLAYGAQVFPGAVGVFCGIDRREIEGRVLPRHVTGVVVTREFAPTLRLALRLHPDANRVLFIGGTSEFDARLIEQAKREFREYESRLSFTYLTALPLDAMVERVAQVPPRTVVLLSTIFQDGAGAAVVPHEAAERITAAANVPVYGFVDQFLGRGIMGGQLYSVGAHGHQAAALVRQILAGKPPSDLPVQEGGAGAVSFDARQLIRWGISESQLPAGSTLVNKKQGAWATYRPQILGAFVVVFLQSAFIGALLIQRARRLRIEGALHQEQQRLSMATAAGAVGVWDWDLKTNEIYVDPTLQSILGLDRREMAIPAAEWGSRIHPDDLAVAGAQTQACIEGRLGEYELEHRMIHKDGSVRWFLSRGSLVARSDGSPERMIGTKVDITARKRAEETIRESEAVQQATNCELQDLAGRLIASQEMERSRLARDLHDGLSQQLAGLSIALSILKRRAGAVPGADDLAADLASLQQRTVGLAEDIRQLSHDLHPTVVEHAGLVAALDAHCLDLQRRELLRVTFTADGDFTETSPEAALCLYRVAQEGLRNVVRHARASQADVRLTRTADHLELTIADDGRGFDIGEARTGVKGLGLVSINERVRLAGGTVSIITEVSKGTHVRVAVPARFAPAGTRYAASA